MDPEPTREQRLAYSDWLLADEAAINARDEVLLAIQGSGGVIDLELIERLSARAMELRDFADLTLRKALAALQVPADFANRLDVQNAEELTLNGVTLIRTIVDFEVHQISGRAQQSRQSTQL